MFTGIVEALGKVEHVERSGTNMYMKVSSPLSDSLKVDQSLSHNGVCLTVTEINQQVHTVCLIEETLKKTNFEEVKAGDMLNLERAMQLGARLDGHLVQGHVDCTGVCVAVEDRNGSKIFTFEYVSEGNITVEKGSITVSGVSLTVLNSAEGRFSVAIIPYTLEHTVFQTFKEGSSVNLEFDMMGKYFKKWAEAYFPSGPKTL